MKPLMVCKRYTKSVCNIMICLLLTLICRMLDGFELTRKLREQNSSLPIWGLTANAQANEREKG